MAINNIYKMMRDKARDMGHEAAKLPDEAWEKYLDFQDRRATLQQAKLYVENYMMGNLEPSEFAQMMAENDNLRYTISDLCRMRLEPADVNIQRNDRYIDVGAGVKTFWTEIKVPLPSEMEAARDLRNINFGIEAGRATAGQSAVKTPNSQSEEREKRKPLREAINEAKKRFAEKAIEKLSPIAEGKESKANAAAEELTTPKAVDKSWLDTEDGMSYKAEVTNRAARQIENTVMNIEAGKNASLSPEDREKAMNAAGVRALPAENEDELFTDQDMDVINGQEKEPERLRSEYTADELNRPLNKDMTVLFDQIMAHVHQERKENRKNEHQNAHEDVRRMDQDRNHGRQQFERNDKQSDQKKENQDQKLPWNPSKEELDQLNYTMGSDKNPENGQKAEARNDMDDYYFHLAEEEAKLQKDDEVRLSAEDLASIDMSAHASQTPKGMAL